jgi:hypothetical protein
MPDFMARIIQLLTVANYGPNLSQLLQHNILGANMPVEILQIIMGAQGASEWQRLRELDEIVRADEIANSSSSGSSSSSAITADVILRERDPDEQQLINDTLNVFSTRIMDMTTLNGVVNLSQYLGMDPASGRNRSQATTDIPWNRSGPAPSRDPVCLVHAIVWSTQGGSSRYAKSYGIWSGSIDHV